MVDGAKRLELSSSHNFSINKLIPIGKSGNVSLDSPQIVDPYSQGTARKQYSVQILAILGYIPKTYFPNLGGKRLEQASNGSF